MYTKPIDVASTHTFTHPTKALVSYEPLDWNIFFDRREMIEDVVPIYFAGTSGHVFVCMHGAGHSALSFAALARYLKQSSIVAAFDFRGHGGHYCENEEDLSEETLIRDSIKAIRYVSSVYPDQSIIIVGHSMGGSIATKTVDFIMKEHSTETISKQIQGLFVIDVVEGSAMDALPFMENIVTSRPTEFKSLAAVVAYGVKSGTIKDLESARVSMPD